MSPEQEAIVRAIRQKYPTISKKCIIRKLKQIDEEEYLNSSLCKHVQESVNEPLANIEAWNEVRIMEEYPKIKHGFLHINKDVAYQVTKITRMRRIENVVYIFIENQTMIHTITCYNEAKAKNVYNQLVTGSKSDS